MTAAATTLDANCALGERLRAFGAKLLAQTVRTSARTTEKWIAGEAGPLWKHTAAMMNNDAMLCELLTAAGRSDVADLIGMRNDLLRVKRALEGLEE